MTQRAHIYIALIVLTLGSLLLALPLPAQASSPAADRLTEAVNNPTIAVRPFGSPSTSTGTTTPSIIVPIPPRPCMMIEESRGGVLIGKIVPCVIERIQDSTIKFTRKMIDWLRPLLYIFLTLVVVLYGVRVASGEPEIHKQGFLLVLKVTLVLTILDQIPDYFVPKTYEIMKESQEIILGAIDETNLQCKDLSKFGDSNTLPLWKLMDCIGGKMFGYTAGLVPGTTSMVLVTSAVGLLTGFLFGGTWGMVIFFGMLGMLFTLFTLIVRTVAAFLNGYITICLMLIICPLLMPLVFLRNTAQYFEGVWKNILAGFLTPIIVSCYAMLALMLYDKMLFADDSLIKSLFDYTKISMALEDPKKPCNTAAINKPQDVRFEPATPDNVVLNAMQNPAMRLVAIPELIGSNDPCAPFRTPVFNLDKVDDSEFGKGKETYNKIFENLVVLFALSFMIQKGLAGLMRQIQTLTGAGVAVGSLSASMQSEFKFQQAVEQSKHAATAAFENKSGKEFLERAPAAARSSIDAFYSGIKRQ